MSESERPSASRRAADDARSESTEAPEASGNARESEVSVQEREGKSHDMADDEMN